MRLAGERHSHHGASMECVVEADYRGTLGIRARYLDGVLYGLSAAVREKTFLGGFSRDKLIELFSQRDVRLVRGHAEAGVQVSLELPLNAFHHRRGTMTYVGASDA